MWCDPACKEECDCVSVLRSFWCTWITIGLSYGFSVVVNSSQNGDMDRSVSDCMSRVLSEVLD